MFLIVSETKRILFNDGGALFYERTASQGDDDDEPNSIFNAKNPRGRSLTHASVLLTLKVASPSAI